MKKLIIFIFVCSLGIFYSMAEVIHKVQRGESIETISQKYGISPNDLIAANKGCDKLFYIGMDLRIPNITESARIGHEGFYTDVLACNPKRSTKENKLALEAQQYRNNYDYDKAVGLYNKLCKKYPRAVYFFNRGLCQKFRGKHRQAAKDFERAMLMEDCTQEMASESSELLAISLDKHENWKSKRNSLFGDIAGIVLGGVVAATEQTYDSQNNESAYSNGKNITGYSSLPNISYPGGGLMNTTPLTWEQWNSMQGQEVSKYMNLEGWKQGNSLPVQTNWDQSNGIQVQAINTENQGVIQSSEGYDYWSQDNMQIRKQETLNRTVSDKCMTCKGTGKCHSCNGSKIVSKMGNTYTCTLCPSNGECSVCHGTGLSSWNR